MKPNPGRCPIEAKGKRVRVRTVGGGTFEAPADGKGAPRWTKDGGQFDIAEYEVI